MTRQSEAAPRGAGSISWMLHRERVLVLGWGRAILLQLAHPLVAHGVAEHTVFQRTTWGGVRRFQRTLDAMLASTFGTDAEMRAIGRRITAIHDRVHGRLPAAAGPFPAGAAYSAHDPALLRWVHATLLDSHVRAYERFVGPLSARARDQYCLESLGMESLLGMPEGTLPRSGRELDEYLAGMQASGEIVVTDTARTLARDVLNPPGRGLAAPLVGLLRLATVGLLPPDVRAGYGFRWTAAHDRALQLSAWLVRGMLRITPGVLRHWPRAREALRASARREIASATD